MNPSLPKSMLQDVNKMKGDAIGDTMYSGRWVLKTLMKLSQKYTEYCNPDDYHLDSDLESDLGLLWDMTIEPDVAHFLAENNAVELIADIISCSCSPRLTEIMVGILGNLACQEHIRLKIGRNTNLTQVIINLLKFTDGPTLIQLIRLLKTCIWNGSANTVKKLDESSRDGGNVTESCWLSSLKLESELLYTSFIFILASSRNEDLLCSTLGLIESLFNVTRCSDDYLCKRFSTEDFIKALLEAINEISSHVEDKTDGLLNHRKLKEASGYWISLLHKLTYCDVGMDALEKQADAVFRIVNTIWVEQSTKCGHLSRNHIVHLMLALELLGALLPLQNQRYEIGHVLTLLSGVNNSSNANKLEEEEEVNVNGGDLKETLENFCFLVLKNWKLKYEVELDDLNNYSELEIGLLVEILSKKLHETRISSSVSCNSKLSELKNLIANIPSDT